MALSRVQVKVATDGSPESSLSFDSSVAAGNLIIVTAWAWDGDTPFSTPSDGTNTYNLANSENHAGNQAKIAIWYAYNISAGTPSIASPASGQYFQIEEFHSTNASFTADPKDKIANLSDDDTPPVVLSSPTLSQADEICIVTSSWANGYNDGSVTETGTGWNLVQSIWSQTIQAGITSYQIVASTSAVTSSLTITGTSGSGGLTFENGITIIATFKEPAGGGAAAVVSPKRTLVGVGT